MDDRGLDLVEVTQRADNLHDDGASLLLRHQLVLLQVEVQVVAFAELQDGAEAAGGETQKKTGTKDKFASLLGNLSGDQLKVQCVILGLISDFYIGRSLTYCP